MSSRGRSDKSINLAGTNDAPYSVPGTPIKINETSAVYFGLWPSALRTAPLKPPAGFSERYEIYK